MEVAHRAVVLRQGRYVGEETPDAEHHERLVSMIVGSGAEEDGDADSGSDAERGRFSRREKTAAEGEA
jgi:ABC-type sugar transport system ATPase subunit